MRELIADLIGKGPMSDVVQDMVDAVKQLNAQGTREVSQKDIRKHTGLPKGTIHRYVKAALETGHLTNLGTRQRSGRESRLVLVDEISPSVNEVFKVS